MKKTIGKRLFARIMAVLLVFIVIALLANTLLLKPVYERVKKNALIDAVNLMNSLEGDYESGLSEILAAEERLAARLLIYKDNEIVYMSSARLLQGRLVNQGLQGIRRGNNVSEIPPNGINAIIEQFLPKLSEEPKYEKVDDSTIIASLRALNHAKYLYLHSTLDDGATMYVVAEMQSLTEAVRIFNLFLLGTAAISMVIILFMTYFMSKSFVKPIRNMNEVTKKISKLDFDATCEVNTQDELQELAGSINTLSGSLETTISDLKKELENAKRLDELRKRFVSTVSHELKTPISLMQGYAIGLKSDVCEQKERRDYYAQVIAEESERLGLLVNELMDLTQLEAGYINLHEEDFELTDFLSETAQKFQAANPEVIILADIPQKELWCRADIRLTSRVLGNYLSNAVRHADGENKITIETVGKKDRYEVKVTNTGKHIPNEKLNEIWNSFYRVDEARTRADGGHGLGLSIVKNIQTAHGMTYGVKNALGGVEFSFSVKKAKKPE